MDKMFSKSEEKFLRAITVFFKAADGILYYDEDFTEGNEVAKADLIDLFTKGLLVVDDGTNLVRPTVLTVTTNYATVTHTTVGAESIAVATSFHSAGYVAG